MNEKLKKIIFNKLYDDLSDVELIPFNNCIWFINRKKEYWYLQYEKSGLLYWRFDFFTEFFTLFSLEVSEFESVIGEWAESIFNGHYKVNETYQFPPFGTSEVKRVSNLKVKSYGFINSDLHFGMQPVLNVNIKEIKPLF
jgi:hypothetical protein